MSNNSKLNELYQKYQEALDQTNFAYLIMQSDWTNLKDAREKMNQAHKHMDQVSAHFNTVWDGFHTLRNYNRHRIEMLRHEAKYASDARRSDIEDEIAELHHETRNAVKEAKKKATRHHKEAYFRAEHHFLKAKNSYEKATQEYERLKIISDQYEKAYEKAKAEQDNNPDQPAP